MIKSISELKNTKKKILILHYACTSVNTPPVIITNISIRDYLLNQTFSFSFDKYRNEKSLLLAFLNYMKKQSNYFLLTWNQKSNTYGIQHLEERCRHYNLQDEFSINYKNVIDLDDSLSIKYGLGYAPNPKLVNIAQLNDITLLSFVNGLKEIDLFKSKQYKRIENSTNRKVAMMADILRLAMSNKLTTQNKQEKILKQKSLPVDSAHFFFVDIVGLSDPEISTEEQIKKIKILNKLILECKSFKKIPKKSLHLLPTGDGAAIGFPRGPNLPLELAIELQKKLNKYNNKKKPSQLIKIRIGINSAPVMMVKDITGNDNVWGDGIIIARRIMDLGDDGHILLSSHDAESLSKLSIQYKKIIHRLGNLSIKHNQEILIYSAYGKEFGNKIKPKRFTDSASKLSKESIFEAGIIGKKKYRLGEHIITRIKFKGKLKGGFFDNMFLAPDGKTFPYGGRTYWVVDKSTHPGGADKPGNLRGDVEYESEWSCPIPEHFPTGVYTVFIRVYDHLGIQNRPVIREKVETVEITN